MRLLLSVNAFTEPLPGSKSQCLKCRTLARGIMTKLIRRILVQGHRAVLSSPLSPSSGPQKRLFMRGEVVWWWRRILAQARPSLSRINSWPLSSTNPKQSSQLRLSQFAISSAAPCNFTLDFGMSSRTIGDSSSILRLAARRLVTLTSQKGIFEMRLSALEAALGRASHSLLVSLIAA
jgi:hypothetical protein